MTFAFIFALFIITVAAIAGIIISAFGIYYGMTQREMINFFKQLNLGGN